MKMSCNGCRVLRKGCGDNCIIKPCLSWIGNPESQAHTTLFLAKFYGRTGLLNLIHAGPLHLRPAIYRSLLYESCGRIINPIFGSVGLLWSGRWHLCQEAVEAVLKGIPISKISSDDSPVKSPGGIRHVNKEMKAKLHKISKTNRSQFKREGSKLKSMEHSLVANAHELAQVRGSCESPEKVWSPEVIEIGSPQSEEQDKIEQEQETAVLDLNMEQISRVRDTDLYKIDLNL
ncbi:LOB domain-containing protein 41-like protein [Carex littledalei]|uniref:LOB domain-containing protein 41-like protein n=1 Tax=Carex littledalei TaxID=544730 RepID=A0A833QPK1_9POAL|nr:LOB domain-containing protein 41-like protein [Carex littledalei]